MVNGQVQQAARQEVAAARTEWDMQHRLELQQIQVSWAQKERDDWSGHASCDALWQGRLPFLHGLQGFSTWVGFSTSPFASALILSNPEAEPEMLGKIVCLICDCGQPALCTEAMSKIASLFNAINESLGRDFLSGCLEQQLKQQHASYWTPALFWHRQSSVGLVMIPDCSQRAEDGLLPVQG